MFQTGSLDQDSEMARILAMFGRAPGLVPSTHGQSPSAAQQAVQPAPAPAPAQRTSEPAQTPTAGGGLLGGLERFLNSPMTQAGAAMINAGAQGQGIGGGLLAAGQSFGEADKRARDIRQREAEIEQQRQRVRLWQEATTQQSPSWARDLPSGSVDLVRALGPDAGSKLAVDLVTKHASGWLDRAKFDETKRMNTAQISNMEAQRRAQTDASAREAQSHAAKMEQYQNLTPQQRAQIAPQLGLAPGSAEHNTFVASGHYSASGDKLEHVKDGETIIRVPKSPGQPAAVVYGSPSNKAQQKFDEAAATKQADRLDETIKQGASQSQSIGTINSLRQLSDTIGAPGIGNTVARTLGPYARSIGVEIGNLSDMEAFTAIVSRLVPGQRPPGSGTMSDKDVDLFKSSLPQLAATAQGRKFIIDQMQAIAEYDVQRAQIAGAAINGKITRQQADDMLMSMPDPMKMFRERNPPAGVSGASRAQSGVPTATGPNGEKIALVNGRWIRVDQQPIQQPIRSDGTPNPPDSR